MYICTSSPRKVYLDPLLQNPMSPVSPGPNKRGFPWQIKTSTPFLSLFPVGKCRYPFPTNGWILRLCSDEGVNLRPCIMQTVSQSQPLSPIKRQGPSHSVRLQHIH
jgi:hypothetical protein